MKKSMMMDLRSLCNLIPRPSFQFTKVRVQNVCMYRSDHHHVRIR